MVQIDSSGELGAGLLSLTGRSIQCAEAPAAVRLERTHAKLLSEGEGLLVVGFGWRALRGSAMRGDLAEEAQGIRLVTAFLVCASEPQRALGVGERLLQAADQYMRLPQGEMTKRLVYRLREQRYGVVNMPG
jgi:hypothetical protein